MKTRRGFVSNSSSSSFTVAAKGEVTKARILAALGVRKDSIFYSFASDVAAFLVPDDSMYVYKSVSEFVAAKVSNGFEYAEIGENWSKEIELLEKGYVVYIGSASDDGYYDSVSPWVCNNQFRVEAEDLFIETEGGY